MSIALAHFHADKKFSAMKPIHPFPARMAPELVSDWLEAHLAKSSVVLDPMCGSGVVLRKAAEHGHTVRGFDVDPLAVLMSRVWMSRPPREKLLKEAELLTKSALRRTRSWESHPTFEECRETKDFAKYWFAKKQRDQLARLCRALSERSHEMSPVVFEALQLCISKTIVTKQAGASLAWDVSHSRPHKVSTTNNFNVIDGFRVAVNRLAALQAADPAKGRALIQRADCRSLRKVTASSIDAVITSPPYLNALDYLRGHKLALIWLGYTIPELREIRSGSIGTERAGEQDTTEEAMASLRRAVPEIGALPVRQKKIVLKYAADANLFLKEMRRVLAPSGQLVLVLADSVVRNVDVSSSSIFANLAQEHGFRRYQRKLREIPKSRRYLPLGDHGTATGGRMRQEVIQAFSVR